MKMKRIAWILVGAACALVGCKSAPEVATEGMGTGSDAENDGGSEDDDTPGTVGEGGVPIPLPVGDGGTEPDFVTDNDEPPPCIPKTCEEVDAECGPVNLGCNQVEQCRERDEG